MASRLAADGYGAARDDDMRSHRAIDAVIFSIVRAYEGDVIHDHPMVARNFEDLVNELLRSRSPKKWFRAYFNMGLINYIYGQPRLLPCDMAFDTFFVDPYGDVMPCNGAKGQLDALKRVLISELVSYRLIAERFSGRVCGVGEVI